MNSRNLAKLAAAIETLNRADKSNSRVTKREAALIAVKRYLNEMSEMNSISNEVANRARRMFRENQ